MGRSERERVKCDFASPARRGSQARPGGDGVEPCGGGLKQWEQPLSLTFHWLIHPTSGSDLGNTRGRNRERLSVLSGKLKVGAPP